MDAKGFMWSSDQMPTSSGEMRPSGTTAVASTTVSPGPRVNMPPTRLISSQGIGMSCLQDLRCAKCHGETMPFFAEYWHMGDT
jgi:hypothetical protein